MTVDQYVTQDYPIECKGRDANMQEVLDEALEVTVHIHKSPGSSMISSNVDCPYNVGGHGDRCKASHPDVHKIGRGVGCPYSFDIPYALEYYPEEEIKERETLKALPFPVKTELIRCLPDACQTRYRLLTD